MKTLFDGEPHPLEVKTRKTLTCFCANNTCGGAGMFLGVSDSREYLMMMNNPDPTNSGKLYYLSRFKP